MDIEMVNLHKKTRKSLGGFFTNYLSYGIIQEGKVAMQPFVLKQKI